MELSGTITLLIVAGWAAMIFAPSFVIALFIAAGFGGASAYLVYLDIPGATPDDLLALIKLYAPIAGAAVFVAYPVAAAAKWAVRKKTSGIRR